MRPEPVRPVEGSKPDPLVRQDLAVVVPTFKRPALLARLLDSLTRQTEVPGSVVVVDGEQGEESVREEMQRIAWPDRVFTYYLRSKHANLPFQRLLGYLAVANHLSSTTVLLYLDDDVLPGHSRCLERLLATFASAEVVGATAPIGMGEASAGSSAFEAVRLRSGATHGLIRRLAVKFGASAGLDAGQLSASGNRIPPEDGLDSVAVQWLRGGVMACRLEALSEECFPPLLLAAAEKGWGLGEDTIISLRLGTRGQLRYVANAEFIHPHSAPPVAYASSAFGYGFAAAFSRRLINDNYRYPDLPRLADRIALVKGFAGGLVSAASKAVKDRSWSAFRLSLGYSVGALRAVVGGTSVESLTPGVDWIVEARLGAQDAEQVVHL